MLETLLNYEAQELEVREYPIIPHEVIIGAVSEWKNGVPIPEASKDIHEAGHRHMAEETYSEPPVDVGEVDFQEELLDFFKDKPPMPAIKFELTEDESGAAALRWLDNYPPDKWEIEKIFSEVEVEKMGELLMPFAQKISRDFEDFKGSDVSPYSLVDELADREEVEFDNPRANSRREKPHSPSVKIELRGGEYRKNDFSGVTDGHFFHNDGPGGGESTSYLASFSANPNKPLNTFISAGIVPGDMPLDYRNGLLDYGVDTIHTQPGKIYRVSSLQETIHSAPIQPEDPTERIFIRAHVS